MVTGESSPPVGGFQRDCLDDHVDRVGFPAELDQATMTAIEEGANWSVRRPASEINSGQRRQGSRAECLSRYCHRAYLLLLGAPLTAEGVCILKPPQEEGESEVSELPEGI
jgi:hypothetical protein